MLVLKKENCNLRSLAHMSLVHLILEYEASCWDLYKEGQINVLDHVQKKVAKFANHMNDWGWETVPQHRKIACICALFRAYTGEKAWKYIMDRLKAPCYLSRNDHNHKIRARKQEET
jgi:hypothetical protein